METHNAHLDDDRVERLRRRTLAPDELLEASRHIRECAACRARVASDPATIQAARLLDRELSSDLGVAPHLDFETLLPYVEGTLPDERRADADAHIEECAMCRAEAEDLREFRQVMAARKNRPRARYVAWAAALAASIAAALFLTRPAPAPPRSETPPGASATSALVVTLRDGARTVGLDSSGKLHGTTVEGAWADVVASALRNPDLQRPESLRGLSGSAETQRGPSGDRELSLREPVGVVVESDRPNFRWSSTLHDAHYELAVFDEAGHVVVRGATRESEWQPSTPLQRDATYLWQVRAATAGREVIGPAPDQPEARFAVLRADLAAQIAAARQRNEGHLVLGVLYFRGGAIADARKEFEALKAENPGSDVARRLVASATR
jgi:anti-sigma factor RsiW